MEQIPLGAGFQNDNRPAILNDVSVRYEAEKRIVSCFCGEDVNRSIVPAYEAEPFPSVGAMGSQFCPPPIFGLPAKENHAFVPSWQWTLAFFLDCR